MWYDRYVEEGIFFFSWSAFILFHSFFLGCFKREGFK